MDFRNGGQPVAVILKALDKAVIALVPAVAQRDFQQVVTPVEVEFEGLILEPAVVDVEAGQQALVALLCAV